MRRRLYDTRFFAEYFYSRDQELISRMKQMVKSDRFPTISSITLHEVYMLALKK